MTQTQMQRTSTYIDLNINNKISKTFSFENTQQAYNFFLTSLKDVAFASIDDNTALISAILYTKNKSSKHVLMKKNLTKVFSHEKNI